MSTTGASLVHPSTSKLGPEDQAKGVYEYTPPMVLAYLRGETLSQVDLADVTVFFGDKGMTLPRIERSTGPQEPALADRSAVMPATFAAAYGGSPQGTAEDFVEAVLNPRKVVKKTGGSGQVGGTGAALFQIADVTLPLLTIEQQTYFFNYLAGQLGYEVE